MNWDSYLHDPRFRDELQHHSYTWNDEIRGWEVLKTEVSVKKETELLDAICNEIDKLISKRSTQLTSKQIQNRSFAKYSSDYFSNNESEECLRFINDFYLAVKTSLARKRSWIGVIYLLDAMAGFKRPGTLHYDHDDRRVESIAKIEIVDFTKAVKEIILSGKLSCKKINDISGNLVLFSFEDIVHRYNKIHGPNPGKRLEFLYQIKRSLVEIESSKYTLLFHIEGKLFPLERESHALMYWIDNSITLLAPPIQIYSPKRRDKVRKFFMDRIDNETLRVDNLEYILNNRFKLVNRLEDEIKRNKKFHSDYQFSVAPGKKGEPKIIITELFELALKLEYEGGKDPIIQDIQNWIFYLFMNHAGKGFSMASIQIRTHGKQSQILKV